MNKILISENDQHLQSMLSQQSEVDFSITFSQLNQLKQFFQSLKEGHFDEVQVHTKSYELFQDIKLFSGIVKGLKEGGKFSMIIDSESVQESFYQKLKNILMAVGVFNVNRLEQKEIIFVTPIKKQPLKLEDIYKKKSNAFSNIKLDSFQDTINEDSLLSNDLIEKKINDQDTGDCSTKPKACKNCSCGRAEAEQLGQQNVKSNCGNCYLGDAYRCSSCPYKGLPAFKPGDNIQLDLSQNDQQVSIENDNKISMREGKIKLII